MSIDREAYSDPLILTDEVARLFGARMYAGLAADVAENDDYRSFIVGGRAITLRRTAEGIRAFNNVCLHRNALIDPLGAGKRPFRCGYHGWRYDGHGILTQTPMMAIDQVCRRQLAEYRVAEAEGLCFVGVDHAPEITGIREALAATGIVVAQPFHVESLDHACNWKLLVENVIEVQHLSHVHARTFVPAGFTSAVAYEGGGDDSVSWARLTPTPQHDRSRAVKRISAQASHHYGHVHVFPDLFLSNTNGLVGYQGNLVPTSATTTRLHWSLFELPALAVLPDAVRAQIRADAISFTGTALLEDRAIIESCQLGLMAEGSPLQLQAEEPRVLDFHRLYLEKMADAGR